MSSWNIVTAEFPPRIGGVADHTYQLARALGESGESVHVWCLADSGPPPEAEAREGVVVHASLKSFSGSGLSALTRGIEGTPRPRRLLIQWVPHGFGWRSMNVAFCLWVLSRARRGDQVEIVLHEPGLDFDVRSARRSLAAAIHRLMAVLLLRAAQKVWVTTPRWEARWQGLRFGKRVPFEWLPLPTGIPVDDDGASVARVRRELCPAEGQLIGSFGLFQAGFTSLLQEWLPIVLAGDGSRHVVLVGSGSTAFREEFAGRYPEFASRIQAVGALGGAEVSHHLGACDLLLQPYPDGVNARRSSLIAGLAHGRPIVTTLGPSTEAFWGETHSVALIPVGETGLVTETVTALLARREEREALGRRARDVYDRQFDIRHAIEKLRPADSVN